MAVQTICRPPEQHTSHTQPLPKMLAAAFFMLRCSPSAEDYIVYQKGELLDAVYLQQNSFDPIDAACDPDRQIHEFNVLYDVLTRDFALSDKKEIRAFFNQVRQEFLDWHNTVFRTPEFEAQEKRLKDFYLSKAAD